MDGLDANPSNSGAVKVVHGRKDHGDRRFWLRRIQRLFDEYRESDQELVKEIAGPAPSRTENPS